ncbi:hypothetical protein ACFQZC_16170 [Streptacidiphilus monticola]
MYDAMFRALRRALLGALTRVVRFLRILRDAAWAAPDRPVAVLSRLSPRLRIVALVLALAAVGAWPSAPTTS